MSPTPSFRVISTSAALTSSAWPRLSSAQGPAISTSGRSLPRVRSPILTCRGCMPVILHQAGLLERGLDERLEQRVRLERARLQLGVELNPDEPRVLGDFDDLRQQPVR